MSNTDDLVDPCRVSFHVIGRFSNGMVYIESLNPQRVWDDLDDFEIQSTLRYMCAKAVCRDTSGKVVAGMQDEPATLIGVIRAQHEGDKLGYYHTCFSDNPTDVEIQCMEGALLRVAVGGNGHLDHNRPYAAEAAIRDTQTAADLGIKFGED
jgi:hypothetical protein